MQKTRESQNKKTRQNVSRGQEQKHARRKIIANAITPEAVPKEEAKKIESEIRREDPPPEQSVQPEGNPEIQKLSERAAIADLKNIISKAKISEEKSKQEEIKTAEIKKDLAPIDLMKYYFSTLEGLAKDCYRRVHETSPKWSALILGKEEKKAVRLLQDELESIFKASVVKLSEEIGKDGFKSKVKELQRGVE